MFERVSVPTPFAVGPVNAYLADRTVVDPGPDSEESWTVLLEALEDRSLAPGDVDRVLVTHPHPDHFGLASRLRDGGASVVASPAAADIIADWTGRLTAEQGFFDDFLEQCGLSAERARTVTRLPEAYLEYAPPVATDRTLTSGDEVTVDGTTCTVHEVTGHAQSELLFDVQHEGERVGLVGDHVLPDITPNPLLQPPLEPDGQRPRVLPAYNDSLAALAEEDYDRFLPGHREEITAPAARVEEILAEHERRTANVLELVDGPTTPAEVMEGLFGGLPATETFPGLSEAVGHLDVLEARGEVVQRDQGGVLVYERTE